MHPEPNLNTRSLRSGPEGFFLPSGSLCQACGAFEKCLPKDQSQPCSTFSPIFTFRSPLVGFDDWFNTFRLGRNWYHRLHDKVGTSIALVDKRKSKLIGYAQLTGVAVGPRALMVERYAWSNHLSIGKKIGRADAPDWLNAILEKNYRTMFKSADHNDPFTVLFMQRIPNVQVRVRRSQENPQDL